MTYPDQFEQLWLLRPQRVGNNPKRKAYNAYNARLKEGHTHSDMIEGLKRYVAFCGVSGTINSPYVMHMSTFLGPDENFTEEWEPPKPEIKETIEQKGIRLNMPARVGETMEQWERRIVQARQDYAQQWGNRMNNATLINQDSGNFEYYTPIKLVEAARLVMGGIDLDPASSYKANELIKSTRYFNEDQDGLTRDWLGNIWLNHPFSRINNPLWINKLISEYENNNIDQACCITFAATSEKWFRPLLEYPQCFIHGRTNYYLFDGTKKKGVTKGCVVTYLGDKIPDFIEVFSQFGTVK